jgi:hypothetical protein
MDNLKKINNEVEDTPCLLGKAPAFLATFIIFGA